MRNCSFGYRAGRSPHMAMRKVWRELHAGNVWIVDADLRQYFDTIDQDKLIDLIAEEISDGRVLQLIRDILQAGVCDRTFRTPLEPLDSILVFRSLCPIKRIINKFNALYELVRDVR